ncbi:hypothetical protein MBLNU230_g0466t2 [Neophaeotheca triangularis]
MTLNDVDSGTDFVIPASEHALTRSRDMTINFPGGASYTMAVGAFSTFGYFGEQNWTAQGNRTFSGNRTLGNAIRRGYLPSMSCSLTVGSVVHEIPGSLVLGGYDSSRHLTEVIASSGNAFDLLDIAINVSSGASALRNTGNRPLDGLLHTLDGTRTDNMTVFPDPAVPYMYLPQATCDAIAAFLPVTYNAAFNLYFWNTSDPTYESIINSPHHLIFTFANDRRTEESPTNSTIKVPFALFNMTLTAPLVDEPTPYFPCSPWDQHPNDREYTLGRAFLQAATLTQIWHQRTIFLSQAPGPDFESDQSTVTIKFSDSYTSFNLDPDRPTWEDTWRRTLPALPESADTSAQSGDAREEAPGSSEDSPNDDEDGGLSTGAIAGVVVAVVVVVVAIIGIVLWRLRQRRKAQKSVNNSLPPQDHHTSVQARDSVVEKSDDGQLHEIGSVAEPVEMGHGRQRTELPEN